MRIKTYSEVLGSVLATIGARCSLTNFNTGSVIRTITEVYSVVLTELYAFASDMLKQGFLDTCTGVWLDRKAKEYGLTRREAVKTEGVVIYSRRLPRNTNVPIPQGSIVTTPKDANGIEYRYFTSAPAVLVAGELSVEVPVIAEVAGSAYNVGNGAITKMTTFITGVDLLSNASDWITVVGADAEIDALLRRRCYLAWEELSQGGTAPAYVSWALSVAGVKSAFVDDTLPRGEGTLDVYIVGEAGPPEPALIEAVQAVVDANRPITADALVRAPESVDVPITMSLTPKAGYDSTVIDTEVRRRLSVYFSDVDDETLDITPLGVGNDVVASRIISVVMAIAGVYSVRLTLPADDVTIASNQYPELGTITITMEAPSNE